MCVKLCLFDIDQKKKVKLCECGEVFLQKKMEKNGREVRQSFVPLTKRDSATKSTREHTVRQINTPSVNVLRPCPKNSYLQ